MASVIQLACLYVAVYHITSVDGQCRPPHCFVNSKGEDTVCHTCGIGQGVVVRDREFITCQSNPVPRNTECEPCIAGVNYSDVDDGSSKCQGCLKCNDETQDVVEECTVAKDTVCRCKPGMAFYDEEVGVCLLCQACPEGQVESSPCNKTHDRQCVGITTTLPPTITTMSSTPSPRISTTTHDIPSPDIAPSGADDNGRTQIDWTIIVIIIGVVGVIILVAAVCYAVRKRRKCTGRDRCSPCHTQCILSCCSRGGSNTIAASVVYGHQMSNSSSQTPCPMTLNANGNLNEEQPFIANGVCINGGPYAPGDRVHQGMPMNGNGVLPTAPQPEEVFPARIRSELISMLTAHDFANRNWRMIAQSGYLRVSSQECDAWERSNPGERLLQKWENEGLSLEEFIDVLREIHRDDIADFLSRPEGGYEHEMET